ncbi:MAG: glycosyltransferase family 4 protein [Terriglobales bacterium]
MKRIPQIAIDFRWLDHLSLGNGQFRYAVDLICGLAEARPEMRFIVLASQRQPVDEIVEVFADSERWTYLGVPRLIGKGALYREHMQYFRLLRKLNIDLLHALHSFVPIWPPVPVIETVYDMMLEIFPEYANVVQSREYRMHKWAFNESVTRAITISQTTADDLARLWHFPKERIEVVHLGPKLPAVTGQVVKAQLPVILAPFNLEPRKNLLRLLQAAATMKDASVTFRLVLFGRAAVDDARERLFREELSRLGLESCTELTGRVSDEELVRLYRSSAVFVFPSLYEGFGLPVLEAMSAGARVVAHQASAMAEVLGDAGYLVDMNDVTAIASAIQKALNDQSIGEKALQRAADFSRERMVRETVEAYRKTLKNAERKDG